jgi:formylglycine-generating enzyme required for sulfatase activity
MIGQGWLHHYPRRSPSWGIGALCLGLLSGCHLIGAESVDQPGGRVSVASERERQCGPDFAYVPGGPFLRGSTPEERDYAYQISAAAVNRQGITEAETRLRQQAWFDHEPDQTRRELTAFCLGRNLVTQAEYQAFVLATGYHPPGITPENYEAQGFRVHPYEATQPYTWQGHHYPQAKAQHPVVLISQQDALAYAAWKSRQDGVTYRLPTAEEWEKAARGTDGQYFPWGNPWQDDATNWQGSEHQGTSAVGAYPLSRSIYGIEDMAGNVFEFTATVFERDQQRRTVMKGCAWDDLPGFCRAAYQHSRPVSSRHILFGFRLARSPNSE